jgi:hypothetical protein
VTLQRLELTENELLALLASLFYSLAHPGPRDAAEYAAEREELRSVARKVAAAAGVDLTLLGDEVASVMGWR